MSGSELRVEVPPDVDVEDRVIGPLTFRHVGYLALAGGGVAIAVLHATIPAVALGTVLVVVGAAGGAWRPQGRPLDTWLVPARAYRERTRRAVTAMAENLPSVHDAPAPVPAPQASDVTVADPATERRRRERRVPRMRLPRPRIPRPSLSRVTRRRPRLPTRFRARVVAAAALVGAAAVGTVLILPQGATWSPFEVPASYRPAPPVGRLPTTAPADGLPPQPHIHSPDPHGAYELSDQEVSDAVDAFFDWLTGP